MLGHCCDLGHNSFACPLNAKDLCELLEVLRAGFTNAKHSVAKPGHAEIAELLVEELLSELTGQKWHVLNDCQADTPLLVLCQLHDRRQKRLRKQVNSDDIVDLLKLRDDVEANIRELILEHLEEHWKQVLGSLPLAQDRRKTADLVAKCGANVLRRIGDKLLDGRHDVTKKCLAVD